MKKNLIILLAIVVVILGGYYLFTVNRDADGIPEQNDHLFTADTTFTKGNEEWASVNADAFALAFDYRVSPDGYVVFEPPIEEADEFFEKAFILIQQDDYAELQASTEPREGPPTINLLVFKNPEGLSAAEWVISESDVSSFGLTIGDLAETTVSGGDAVRFTIDGLYRGDVVVTAHGDRIFFFSGAYLEEGSPIHLDFSEILDTIRLG
jgi:hypothetical protein